MQKLTRHFFISDDLNDLERLEQELEQAGVVTPQIHVLTLDDGAAAQRQNLHTVPALLKRDLIHSGLIGAGVGVFVAVLVLLIAALTGWTETPAGWIPFIFLAIIAFGFFTWEGGLLGIETPNASFRGFERALEQGRHVFFVDLEPERKGLLEEIARRHPSLEPAGIGRASPHWIVRWQHRVRYFFTEVFP